MTHSFVLFVHTTLYLLLMMRKDKGIKKAMM